MEGKIGKKGKIAKFDSKIFGTPRNLSKKGKMANFGSKYVRTPGNKSKRGKIGKIVKS